MRNALFFLLPLLLVISCGKDPLHPSQRLADHPASGSPRSGNPSANGGGTALEGGEISTFTFNAVQQQDGTVKGHLMYNIRVGDVTIWMDIDCLNIVGNQAALSGTVTKIKGTAPWYIFVGQRAVFNVVDNGEGNGESADLVSDVHLFADATCQNPFPVPYIAIDGNVQVNP